MDGGDYLDLTRLDSTKYSLLTNWIFRYDGPGYQAWRGQEKLQFSCFSLRPQGLQLSSTVEDYQERNQELEENIFNQNYPEHLHDEGQLVVSPVQQAVGEEDAVQVEESDEEKSLLESDDIELTPDSQGPSCRHPAYTQSADDRSDEHHGLHEEVGVPQRLRVLVGRLGCD